MFITTALAVCPSSRAFVRLGLIWIVVICIIQIAIPIELGHTGFAGQIAEIIESFFEIGIFGFQSLESLEQQFLGELVQFNVERIELLDFLLLLWPQIAHRRTRHRRIVLFEWKGKAQVEGFLKHVLRYLRMNVIFTFKMQFVLQCNCLTFWCSVSPKYAIDARFLLALANKMRSRSNFGIDVRL